MNKENRLLQMQEAVYVAGEQPLNLRLSGASSPMKRNTSVALQRQLPYEGKPLSRFAATAPL